MIDEKITDRIRARVREAMERPNPYRRSQGMVTDLDGGLAGSLAGHEASNLMDSKAVAAYLGVKVETLAQWRLRREGPPFVKAGRSIRYRLGEIQRWLDQGR